MYQVNVRFNRQVDEENIPGLLLLVDFEKAFDSIEWCFIEKTLEFYNFGPRFKKSINCF